MNTNKLRLIMKDRGIDPSIAETIYPHRDKNVRYACISKWNDYILLNHIKRIKKTHYLIIATTFKQLKTYEGGKTV